MAPDRSLQDVYFPELRCFGCGPANADGLHLRSFADGDGRAVARFTPSPHHDNGLGYLNGGIIATLLDCHSAAAVTHAGNNSAGEALRAGVPMLALPLSTDQFAIAADLERVGAGVCRDPNRLTADEVAEAVGALTGTR